MKEYRTTVIAITSDQHCGSTVAVCPNKIKLDDGGLYVSSKAQRWLWNGWEEFWKTVAFTQRYHDARLIQAFNGDFTDGDHHGTTQILSGNPTAQASVVNACMEVPLSLNPDKLLFIRGTEAHVGKSACFEERIAMGLKKDRRPVIMEETGLASHWHARLTINGVRLDFAHHGAVGTRPWTTANGTENLAAMMFYEHAKNDAARNDGKLTHPHLAIRSHMHQYVDTADKHPVRVIQTPSWQLKTAFIHRIDTSGKLADVGGIIVVIHKDGSINVSPVLFKPKAPKVITF